MDSASRSVEDVELEGYFLAALGFIDSQLNTDASLAEIEAAAGRRQQSLVSLPEQVAEADLAQLAEALDFIRRKYDLISHDQIAQGPPQVESAIDPHAEVAKEAAQDGHAVFEVSDLGEPTFEVLTHTANGHHSNGNGHVEEPPSYAAPEVVDEAESFFPKRRSPLSRLWEEAEKNEERADELPEAKSLPLARGALLLAYESWLALFAGWVATRCMVWLHPGLGYEVSFIYGNVIALVGLAAACVAAWLIWRYRTATHHTAALFHAGAVLVLLDLLRWKVAAGEVPKFEGPGLGMWEALVLAWIVTATYAHISDLRAR